ncbi:MAG: signal peptide peptidase SppA [Pirellulales bacterium]
MDSPSNPQQQPGPGAAPGRPNSAAANPMPTGQLRRRPPLRVIVEQSMGLGRKLLFGLLLGALAFSVMINFGLYGSYSTYVQTDPKMNETLHSGSAAASDKIAIISVGGAILDSDGFVKQQIDRVRQDKNVKAIVLRVDSPGGTVTASHYLFHHLKELQKEKEIPLVVSMGGIAASGGYYISMAVGDAEDTIFAEETTWTGSIGVIIPNYDISGLMEDWKITDRSYASGQLKQMGSPTRKADTVEVETFNALIQETFDEFKNIVKQGRPNLANDKAAMNEISTGQIFTAKQAKRLGLVDKLGYIEDAIDRAADLAALSKDSYRVVQYDRPQSLFDITLMRAPPKNLELSALLDLTTPRAYYLCTWLPSIAANKENRP